MSWYYVAGPMRNIPRFNFDTFDSVAKDLETIGHKVSNPAAHDRQCYPDIEQWEGFAAGDISKCPKFDLAAAMRWDLDQVIKCDGIILLPGWEKSSGAAYEVVVAKMCGKSIGVASQVLNLGESKSDPLYAWLYESYSGPLPEVVKVDSASATKVLLPAGADPTHYRVGCVDIPADPIYTRLPSGEVRTTDPTTGGQKGVKLARFDLIPPIPLKQIAEVYGHGAKKYAERNWERGYAWSKSYGALMRHITAFWSGETFDQELGTHHCANVAFHCLALMEFTETHPELDDRPRGRPAREKILDQLTAASENMGMDFMPVKHNYDGN